MIATLFIVLILLAIAWAAHQFLPHPIGVVFAVICGLIALYVLVTAFVGDTETAEAALGAPFLLGLKRRNVFHNRLVDWDVLRLGR